MKNIIKKSIFILALLGLCTFTTHKEARAYSSNCKTIIICCSENDCHYCTVCNVGDLTEAYQVLCGYYFDD